MDDEITTATQRVFQKLTISAPLSLGQTLQNLQNIGAMYSELTINVGQHFNHPPAAERRRSWRRRLSDQARRMDYRLSGQPEQRRASQQKGRDSPLWTSITRGLRRRSSMMSSDSATTVVVPARRSIEIPSTSSTSAPVPQDDDPEQARKELDDRALQMKEDDAAIEYWTQVFFSFPKINTLTFCVKGETGWPGSTDTEYVLVVLRAALELADLPYLRRVRFQPLHAMGVVVMRWSGFNAISSGPRTGPRVWQNITSLDLQINNPFDQLSDSQKTVFLHMLHDYLLSFSTGLRYFRFIWLGQAGPSPLTLEDEPALMESDMESHEAIYFDSLEQLWLGNINMLDRTIRIAVEQHAPKVYSLKTLRSGVSHVSAGFEEHLSWVDVVLPPRASTTGNEERRRMSEGWWNVVNANDYGVPAEVANTDVQPEARQTTLRWADRF